MIILKKRLFFWLIKAYLRKMGKRLLVFFSLGLLGFFIVLQLMSYFLPKVPLGEKETIGLIGAYTLDTLPPVVISDLSKGLTWVEASGEVKTDIAESYKIEEDGKKYTFFLKKNVRFSDNTPLTAHLVNYAFQDVKIEKPTSNTIVFHLKASYSPFLVTVSQPIFKKGFVGVGEFKIKDIQFNGDFIQSLILVDRNNQYHTKTYQFYPSEEALKIGFVMGEVSKIIGITNLQFEKTTLDTFPNTTAKKNNSYSRLVTLFYNTKDPVLSDEKIRNALSYGVPDEFAEGTRSYGPFFTTSWAYLQTNQEKFQDTEHAKTLLASTQSASSGAKLSLTIKTLPQYEKVAETVKKEWEKMGVSSKIEVVNIVPATFQIFLADFRVPKDPDQYTLWHSSQPNNITKYNEPRIDKLLEDGRIQTDMNTRRKIYGDFQKYLLADSPATFLYFPTEYEVVRK